MCTVPGAVCVHEETVELLLLFPPRFLALVVVNRMGGVELGLLGYV